MAEPTPLQPVLRYLQATVGPEASGVSDGELVRRFATNRDEAAFELLWWRHGAMVQRVCQTILHDHHAAEDACQATFLTLARQAGRITQREAVAGWLYRVARRIAVRSSQQRQRQVRPVWPDVADPTSDVVEAEDLRVLHEEIACLPERYRVPVLLCFLEGLTHADAAKRLCWPIGTVAGRLARAKALLQHRLTRRGLCAANLWPLLLVDRSTAFTPAYVQRTSQAALLMAQRTTPITTVSPQVLALSNGVLRTMKYTKWAYSLGAFLLVIGLGGGTWVFAQGTKPTTPQATPTEEAKETLKPTKSASEPTATIAQRIRSKKNLHQIALAIWNYHDATGHFPQDITDNKGKPLLSWRVAILPYIEQHALYKAFKLDQPWDSEHNKPLSQTRIKLFTNGSEPAGDMAETFYQFFAGEGTIMDPGKKMKVTDVTDGTSNTFGVIEAGPSVPWAKPADINYHPKKGIPKLVGPYANLFYVAMLDGSVQQFKPNMDEELMHTLIRHADGNPIDEKKLAAAKALHTANTDEEKQFVAEAQKKIVQLSEQLAKLVDENIQLKNQLQQQSAKAQPNIDEVADTLERLLAQVAQLKRQNADLRQELANPKTPKK